MSGMRHAFAATLLAAALAVSAAGCSAGGEESTNAAPNPVDTASITCGELQSSGGELGQAFATELAAEVAKGRARAAAANALETILTAGCRGEPSSFRPAEPALKEYRREHPG
jgi:hypothetical protein